MCSGQFDGSSLLAVSVCILAMDIDHAAHSKFSESDGSRSS